MKKQMKKLVLAKETVRRLTELDLKVVDGGASLENDTYCYPYRCPNMPATARC